MQTALSPSLKALVASELMKHSDDDVKVAVASCISEITRITAPDAPYDDDQMKVLEVVLGGSFKMLFQSYKFDVVSLTRNMVLTPFHSVYRMFFS